MTKDVAREWLTVMSQYGVWPINMVRELYNIAEWELPEHLKPRPLPTITKEVLKQIEDDLFRGDI